MSGGVPWQEADRQALQEIARASREAASRPDVSSSCGALLEAVADAITLSERQPEDVA